MATNIYEFVKPINGMLIHDKHDENHMKFITKVNFEIIEQFLLLVNDQQPLPNSYEIASYKVNMKDGSFVESNYDVTNPEDKYYCSTIYYNGILSIDILSPMTTTQILSSSNTKYIFYPMLIHIYDTKTNKYKVGHITFVLFDTVKKKIYLIDSNGRNCFPCWNCMYYDIIFDHFTEEINFITDDNYAYVSSNVWNKNNYELNRNFDDSVIGSGHCVCISLLLIHYLSSTGRDITEIFEKFNSLDIDVFIELIFDYTNGFFNLFYKE
jgi:hypothetical protein